MKKVLVTGATGFIGNHVIERLLEKGYSVVASSASAEKAAAFSWFSKVDYRPFDLTQVSEQEDYYTFFGKPDILIHLAWEGLPNYKNEFHLQDNLPRHFTFIKNLVRHGLKDITVTGTCFEYGMQEGRLSEDMPVFPANPYAQAKNELRILLEDYSKHHPFLLKWVRLFYMYGKGQNPNSLLSQLNVALEKGDASFNMSPGDQLRDYLPIEKVAAYLVEIAVQQAHTGIINCCSGNPIEVKQLVIDYLQSKSATIELNLGYYPYSDLEPRNFWGDNTKLKTILMNNPIEAFVQETAERIQKNETNTALQDAAKTFNTESNLALYSYNFRWMGRPIIQYPQDILAMQELIWEIKPDLIIETGIAHGGSLIFYASMMELVGKGEVLGIDIDIRAHNRKEIESHPMFKRITMIQGSSIAPEVVQQVKDFARDKKVIMVVLDSNHTHEHVMEELKAYAPLVSLNSYVVVFDTIVEYLPNDYLPGHKRPWGVGDNPLTAVKEYIAANDQFVIDQDINNKLLISVAPDGYLKRIK